MGHDFKAVIFDFDGVVVDSLRVHLQAWRQATLELFGKPIEDFENNLAGRATIAISEIICEKLNVSSRATELAERKKQILRDSKSRISLVPGLLEFRDQLLARKIPFGIASNAPRKFIEMTLASHELKFAHYMGLEDAPRPKPAPDLFLRMATQLGVQHPHHDKVLVFEDSTHGVAAAVSAGMYAIGVCTQHPAAILKAAGCRDTVDDHFQSIKKFLA